MMNKTLAVISTLVLAVSACAQTGTGADDSMSALAPVGERWQAPKHWLGIDGQGRLASGAERDTLSPLDIIDAKQLDTLTLNGRHYAAALVGPDYVPTVFNLAPSGSVTVLASADAPDFLPETLCLGPADAGGLSLFVIDERGSAEQWRVSADRARHVRSLPIPPNTTACAPDADGRLYVAEEGMGVWAYNANPERAPARQPVDLTQPFGGLAGGTETLAVLGRAVFSIATDSREVHLYTLSEDGWSTHVLGEWASVVEPEALRVWWDSDAERLSALVRDDETGRLHSRQWPSPVPAEVFRAEPAAVAHTAQPLMQTRPVARFGDAADDPAIWVHPGEPAKSRILGTDKKHGLMVYDLNGERLQNLPTGRLNNVDLRYGFDWNGRPGDIAVATQRDDNTLSVYRIDPASGEVTHVGEKPTGLEAIYGFCLYQSDTGTYAIANGKGGRFEQYRLSAAGEGVDAELVRTFAVTTQPEGCVADDARGQLFVGEEARGVWTLPAEPDAGDELTLVRGVDDILVADVEGLALYPATDSRYLVISSQGDHSYVVLQSRPPYELVGKFRVGPNSALGIDGISETDGLEVTHRPLGEGLARGAMVAQDGHNVMPERPQNFKLVSWQAIEEALGLNE